MSVNYSLNQLSSDKVTRSHIFRALELIKSKYRISGKFVVELGCGLCQNLEVFRGDCRVMGLEGLDEAVAAARDGGFDVRKTNLEEDLPEGIEQCDVVLCLDVLEHIANTEKLGHNIRRLMRDDGIAVLNVPNHFSWKGRLKLLRGSGLDVHGYFPGTDDWNNPHLRFFTREGFLRFVDQVGLSVVEDLSETVGIELTAGSGGWAKRRLKHMLYRAYPALLSPGFFVVCRKKGAPAG